MKFVETSYNSKKEILKFNDHYVAVPVMITDTGVSANADGKKIVPAGTVIGTSGANPILSDATMVGTKTNTQGTNGNKAEGILLNDVDVTYGPASGALVIHGFIDTAKLPEAVCADAKTALAGKVVFIA